MKIKARLYCPQIHFNKASSFPLPDQQAHYIRNVMRAKIGDILGLFNGDNGEYACRIIMCDKKQVILETIEQTKTHLPPDPITLVFALIKKAPLEYLVQKATELGVGILQPITTDRTIIRDFNHQRLEAIAIEAAEQCGLTAIPIIKPVKDLQDIIHDYHTLLFCDEKGTGQSIAQAVQKHKQIDAVLIGPEGGFTPQEADFLYEQNNCLAVSLGKRIMRAETAAVASLAVVQSWKNI